VRHARRELHVDPFETPRSSSVDADAVDVFPPPSSRNEQTPRLERQPDVGHRGGKRLARHLAVQLQTSGQIGELDRAARQQAANLRQIELGIERELAPSRFPRRRIVERSSPADLDVAGIHVEVADLPEARMNDRVDGATVERRLDVTLTVSHPPEGARVEIEANVTARVVGTRVQIDVPG
jgi:hypothetical protein